MKTSILGKQWISRTDDLESIKQIQDDHNLPELLARILVGRNVDSEHAEHFINPKLKYTLPDPFHLLDMQKGVERILEAILNNETIAIFGDYDVDGATSSSLLRRYFRMLRYENVVTYIPDRMKEGYGPNIEAMRKLKKDNGAKVIITVDCGIVSYEPLRLAKEEGIDVIVIDHHIGNKELPEAVAVINPNRYDETSSYTNLAAVGVSFLFVVALTTELMRLYKTYYSKPCNKPDLLSLLDIVALGTVCDVMTLTGLNRTLVRQGLKVMSARQNIGIKALCDSAGLYDDITTYHCGYVLGPRINAGGRIGKAALGSMLLTTTDPKLALSLAERLTIFNNERKDMEKGITEQAMSKAKEIFTEKSSILLVTDDSWHAGLIGIVASRLKSKFDLPTAVGTRAGDMYKFSARSVPGVDLGGAVIQAQALGIIDQGGGHMMAAGFSVKAENIPELILFFQERFADDIVKYRKNRRYKYDCLLNVNEVSVEFINRVNLLGPYGTGNPEPRFAFKCQVTDTKQMGQDGAHVKCTLSDQETGVFIEGVAFNATSNGILEALIKNNACTVIGKLTINSWQNKETVNLIIEDIIL